MEAPVSVPAKSAPSGGASISSLPAPAPAPAPVVVLRKSDGFVEPAYQAAFTHRGGLDTPEAYEACTALLKEWGVVVIPNVFSATECDTYMAGIGAAICGMSDGFKPAKATDTWKAEILPPWIRDGLFRTGISGHPAVTRIRSDDRMSNIFRGVQSYLFGRNIGDLVTSIDSVNFRPPVAPFFTPAAKDWPHVDVTGADGVYSCIQGQVVLSNSTAAFRCSPKSHLLYKEFLSDKRIGGNGFSEANWNMFSTEPEAVRIMATALGGIGGLYQVPIFARKGTVILWLSSTVHSAQVQAPPVKDIALRPAWLTEGPCPNYRGVVYVCLRPRADVDQDHIDRLQMCEALNRQTNHWGERVFPLIPQSRVGKRTVYTEKILKLARNPLLAFEMAKVPRERTPAYMRLLGYSEDAIAAKAFKTAEDYKQKRYQRDDERRHGRF